MVFFGKKSIRSKQATRLSSDPGIFSIHLLVALSLSTTAANCAHSDDQLLSHSSVTARTQLSDAPHLVPMESQSRIYNTIIGDNSTKRDIKSAEHRALQIAVVEPLANPAVPGLSSGLPESPREPSKETREQAAHEADRFVEQQADAVNKLPGAQVRTEDVREEKTEKKGLKLSSLNPLNWLLSPITKLQNQTVRLEQQIVKLIGPIGALQPAMLGLEKKIDEMKDAMRQMRDGMGKMSEGMVQVHSDMKSIRGAMNRVDDRIGGISKGLTGVSGQLGAVKDELVPMRAGLSAVSREMAPMGQELKSVSTEMVLMHKDIQSVARQMSLMKEEMVATRANVGRLEAPIRELKDPVVSLKRPITSLASPLTTVGGRMEILQQELNDLKTLMTMVLTSIFICAALIAIGTPLAAIWVWRNRAKLLPPPNRQEAKEERSLPPSA